MRRQVLAEETELHREFLKHQRNSFEKRDTPWRSNKLSQQFAYHGETIWTPTASPPDPNPDTDHSLCDCPGGHPAEHTQTGRAT